MFKLAVDLKLPRLAELGAEERGLYSGREVGLAEFGAVVRLGRVIIF